jgi:pimeloyl-ACP methyl ester carboxylesterase
MNRVARLAVTVLLAFIGVAMTAYVLVQRPDIPYARLEARYGGPASRYMDLPGGLRIHYRDQGRSDGPVVVMVHGFGASLLSWEPWVARLGHDYRIVTLDLPGHGLTRAPSNYAPSMGNYADLVNQVARRLRLGPYVMVGNAMGGEVAWDDALRHRSDVRALVLVDCAGWPEVRRDHTEEPPVTRLVRSPLGRLLLRDRDTTPLARRFLMNAYLDPVLVTPALVRRYVEMSRAPGHRDILLAIRSQGHGPAPRAALKTIAVPTLVMHGLDDKLIPYTDGQAFAATIPGARFIGYPGVGHFPMEQIPARSAADLKAFLDGLGARPAAKP